MTERSARDESRDGALFALGQLARRARPDAIAPLADSEGKRRLRAAVTAFGRRRSPWRRPAFALAAALVVASATVFAVYWPTRATAPLAYRVESPTPSAGGYLQASGSSPAIAHFSDGTDVRVERGARARIVSVDHDGARIALEQGRARLHVVHLPGARWSVDAGPFTIAVTGTEFDVDWQSNEGALAVELHVGSVVVRGPLAPDGIGVHAGQRLLADLDDGRVRLEPAIAPDEPKAAPDEPSSDGTTKQPAAGPAPDAPTAPPADRALPATSWTKRVAAGQFQAVLAEARARGLSSTLGLATLADLVALADAARYSGSSDVARAALLAQRKRFAGSSDARAAAFLLGRLADDAGSVSDALAWYDRYLAEAQSGSFAAEALGRRMLATRRASGAASARPYAERYLRRFPNGPYARAARELASGD